MALNGIDISNWQKGINLDSVPYDFVISKATEGTSYVSPDCARQVEQVRSRGKLFGTYHYINGSGANSEAEFYIKSIKNWVGKGIICLDWESQGNKAWGSVSYLRNVAKKVIDLTGIPPVLYGSKAVLSQLRSVSNELNCGLWVAQYANDKTTGYQASPWNEGAYSCAIRQYSSKGRLSGYSGNLDLNKFYGDQDDWMKYANPSGAGGSTPSGDAESTSETPSGSTLDLVYHIVTNNINGDARKSYCGSRYDEVMDFINHIYNASDQTLADEIKAGRYGDNPVREAVLTACGGRYRAAQDIVNGKSSARTYTVERGDTLSGIGAKLGVDWKSIASKNGIKSPYTIYPGQKLSY